LRSVAMGLVVAVLFGAGLVAVAWGQSGRSIACRASLQKAQTEIPATGGRVWVWVQTGLPVRVGAPNKMVWRLDGAGVGRTSFLSFRGSDGRSFGPVGGVYHTGSNWQMGSGTEFGQIFTFPRPGCWTVDVTDGPVRGSFMLAVRPA
jgi:hypothetical protein